MADIDTVKACQCCVESDISLSECGASEITTSGQYLLHTIESSKHLTHGLVIGFLFGGKTSSIHTIVDVPKWGRV